jgi:outer membrane protein OmpA-like peptidoglycan-associated protein
MSLTTALISIIVVILFVMLMLSMNNKLFPSSTPKGDSRDITTLEERNEQLRAEANAERARLGLAPLPEGAAAARAMANRLRRDATDLAALTIQWQTELEAKDAALTDLQSQITARDQNAQQLYAQISALQTKLDQNANAESMVVTLRNDLQIAQNQLLTYQKQLAEAQGRPTSEAMTKLRAQLDESQLANKKLAEQVDALLAQTKNAVDQAKYDELAAELARIRPEYNAQRSEIQRLRAELDNTRLFVEKGKDLPAIAAKLFERLKTLDNLSGEALTNAYQQIEMDLGARIVHLQSFATGSAEVTLDREKMIKAAATLKAKPNSFFLVVGYASTTGNKQSNYELSRKRATTTASVLNALKKPEQAVKAVYLGQTNRFDKKNPLKNQICEVWEIDR